MYENSMKFLISNHEACMLIQSADHFWMRSEMANWLPQKNLSRPSTDFAKATLFML